MKILCNKRARGLLPQVPIRSLEFFKADGTHKLCRRLFFVLVAALFSYSAQAQDMIDAKFALARYNNSNGSPDNTFDGDGLVINDFSGVDTEEIKAVAIQSDGKIVVAGDSFTNVVGVGHRFVLARYNSNGSPDNTFDGDGKVITSFPGFSCAAYALALQTDGKIVVVGDALNNLGKFYFIVARYNTNGSLDATFDGDGWTTTGFSSYNIASAKAVAIQSNGRIVVAGHVGSPATTGDDQFALARYRSNGKLDSTFDVDGKLLTNFTSSTDERVYALAIQTDGRIVAAGEALVSGGKQFALARYNTNGSLDTGFSGIGRLVTNFTSSTSEFAHALRLQTDGKIVAAGEATVSGSAQIALARYNSNGSLDTGFSGIGKVVTNFTSSSREWANGLAIQSDGRIVIAGRAVVGGSNQFALARYTTTGGLDPSFDGDGKLLTNFPTTAHEWANAVAIQTDGKIVAVGEAGTTPLNKNAGEAAESDFTVPENFALFQNYPNPFNPTTTIQFDLQEASRVTLRIFNSLGQEVATVLDQNLAAGRHTASFDASGLPSGAYFYRLSVNGFTQVKRMEVVK